MENKILNGYSSIFSISELSYKLDFFLHDGLDGGNKMTNQNESRKIQIWFTSVCQQQHEQGYIQPHNQRIDY
jgi:hypothetical protein